MNLQKQLTNGRIVRLTSVSGRSERRATTRKRCAPGLRGGETFDALRVEASDGGLVLRTRRHSRTT